MATTTFNSTVTPSYAHSTSGTSLLGRFFQWCSAQNENRLLWLGIILAAHGCILTPVTVMISFIGGQANLTLIVMAILAMAMALVTNLAAMPTKYTLPVFALSILIDIAVVIAALVGF